jgi:hypothetical protein
MSKQFEELSQPVGYTSNDDIDRIKKTSVLVNRSRSNAYNTALYREEYVTALRADAARWFKAFEKVVSVGARYEERIEALQQQAVKDGSRIAELERRLQQPEQGEVLVTVSGFTGCGKSAVAGEIEIALRAIGLPVTWTNGDAEKRMTGADWLSAIEMYNPRVRIVEQNVARTAGFKVEGE